MSDAPRLRRLLQLLGWLGSGRLFNARQLAEMSGVSRRTIFRDLAMLQASGVVLCYDEQQLGYSLVPGGFLPPADLTVEETLALIVLSYELGGDDSPLPFLGPARRAALKLVSNLPQKLRDSVTDVAQRVLIRLDQQDAQTTEPVRQVFQTLQTALAGNRCVRIAYKSLSEGGLQTRLSPYRVLFSRRSWYVIGRSSVHRAVRTFKVGRILSAELLNVTYEPPPRFDLERYLGNAWHLIREPGESSEVRIRFGALVAQNVAEVQWHKTQRLTWNADGTLDFHVTVDGLNEISWWILGYGHQAEVLEPVELRQLLAGRIAQMAAVYGVKPGEP